MRDLCDARELPGPDDVFMALEREGRLPVLAHGRRVSEHRLWVWYLATDERLEVVGLTAPRARRRADKRDATNCSLPDGRIVKRRPQTGGPSA